MRHIPLPRIIIAALALAALCLSGGAPAPAGAPALRTPAGLPLAFEPNAGQSDAAVRYQVRAPGRFNDVYGTVRYGLSDRRFTGRLSFMDVVDALDAMKKPTVLVIQQKWPDGIMKKAGLAGEMMVSSMMAVGCVGLLSNGPSRDVDAIRKLKFQYLLGGVTAGHGEMAVQAVNVPVSVGGMDVAPGDLIHMDENGAVKFPEQHAEAVVKNATAMLEDEARRLVQLRKAKSAKEVRAANAGGTYTQKNP